MSSLYRQINIAYIVKTFPKVSETFILQEILELERHGINITIFSLQRPTDANVHREVSKVKAPIYYLPACESERDDLSKSVQSQAASLSAQAVNLGIDHIHAHFASEPTAVAELASLQTGIPFSFTAHAKDIFLSGIDELKRKIGRAQFVLTCTQYNKLFLEEINTGQTPIVCVYHGLDLDKFYPPLDRFASKRICDRPLILSVGRYREKKGFPTLIRACGNLKQQGHRFNCKIVGYGPLQKVLEDLIREVGVEDCVELIGKMTHEKLLNWYRKARVFVLPCQIGMDGDRDGIPNVLVEAMAMGVPVVTTQVASIPELLIHEKQGLLVEPKDPAALAGSISKILDDPKLESSLALNAYERVTQNFCSKRNSAGIRTLFINSVYGGLRETAGLHRANSA